MTTSIGVPPPVPGRGPPRPPPKTVKRDDPPTPLWKTQSAPPALPSQGAPPPLPKKKQAQTVDLPPAPGFARAPDSKSRYEETLESDAYQSRMLEAKEKKQSKFMIDGEEFRVVKDTFNLKDRKEAKRSQFGPMSRYMALNASVCSLITGMASMRLSTMGDDGKSKWGSADALAGTFAFFLAFPLFYWEYYYEQSRKLGAYPKKAIIYFLLGILPWISFPTMTLAMHLWVISLGNFLAWRAEEEYTVNKRRKKVPPVDVRRFCCCATEEVEEKEKKEKVENTDPFLVRMYKEYETILRQGDGKMWGFVAFWILLNFIIMCERWDFYYNDFSDKNDASEAAGGEIVMVPFWIGAAKAFGTLLDLNMSCLLIPVCRTFIRMLYNLTTANRGTVATCLKYVFSWTPLDKNLDFHKFLAGIVWFSAWAHTLAHMFNYAKSWETYEAVWGGHIWFSGIVLLLIIHIIYSSAIDDIRWGKFELFWYNHQLFVLFFGITLLHGENLWNPNFWKYFLFPGTMYAIERGLREYRTRQNFGIVSVTHMESVMPGKKSQVFALEMEKQGAMENFREGQYVFLKCPYISKYQWHPFTVASAPQAKTFTCIIRNQGPGSWTDKLQEYLKLLGPKDATHYKLTRRDGNKFVPQYLGPDGTQLIQVDGPYAAPTQHCSEYNVSVIVGAGIGVTPLRATMQSIVHHRWPYTSGAAHPDHGHFHWMLRWSDLATFSFMMRTIRDVEDDWADQCEKNARECEGRGLEIHIWLSRVPKEIPQFIPPGARGEELTGASVPSRRNNDRVAINVKASKTKLGKTVGRTTEMFGPAVDAAIATKEKNSDGIMFTKSGISEMDIYKACWQGRETKLGHIHIHNGRPKWGEVFQDLSNRFKNEHVGFMLCGPAAIADALKIKCGEYSAKSIAEGTVFRLHSENF